MIGHDGDEHDAPDFDELMREADALAQQVDRMEDSARKKALTRRIAQMRSLIHDSHPVSPPHVAARGI